MSFLLIAVQAPSGAGTGTSGYPIINAAASALAASGNLLGGGGSATPGIPVGSASASIIGAAAENQAMVTVTAGSAERNVLTMDRGMDARTLMAVVLGVVVGGLAVL